MSFQRAVLALLFVLAGIGQAQAAPRSPENILVRDVRFDAGHAIQVRVLFVGYVGDGTISKVVIEHAREKNGLYTTMKEHPVTHEKLTLNGKPTTAVNSWIDEILEDAPTGEPFWFRAYSMNEKGEKSSVVSAGEPGIATRQWFDGKKFWLFIILTFVCGSVIGFILLARRGAPMRIRKIAALDAIDEAVGRATEMGRSCLFVTGVQDLNEIETIAGITVLSRVAQKAAEYDATVVVPTSRSLVMTAARETSQAAFLAAGRPDAYQEDRIYYVTDDQFGFVAHLSGYMLREKPAACFYMGQFYAESLLLGETGNTIGAIQIAGTAQPAQLPFFVAACDYTLIGEEFFAASAYLSRDPDQLGSLKGQDLGKLLVMTLLLVGVSLMTLSNITPSDSSLHHFADSWADYLRETMMKSS